MCPRERRSFKEHLSERSGLRSPVPLSPYIGGIGDWERLRKTHACARTAKVKKKKEPKKKNQANRAEQIGYDRRT